MSVWCRNMYVSSNSARTWVEVTEPMMKAYVSWKTGIEPAQCDKLAAKRIKTDGFNRFLTNGAEQCSQKGRFSQQGSSSAIRQHVAKKYFFNPFA
jgi:hypothetical protein